jgi:hypothetical protein
MLHSLNQRIAARQIEAPHAPNVAFEVTLFNERGESRLLGRRALAIDERARCGERVYQLLRNDHIAQPQRRQQHFAETSDVHDVCAVVEALQRCDRPAAVPILAVVVVLENPRTAPLREAGAIAIAVRGSSSHRAETGVTVRRRPDVVEGIAPRRRARSVPRDRSGRARLVRLRSPEPTGRPDIRDPRATRDRSGRVKGARPSTAPVGSPRRQAPVQRRTGPRVRLRYTERWRFGAVRSRQGRRSSRFRRRPCATCVRSSSPKVPWGIPPGPARRDGTLVVRRARAPSRVHAVSVLSLTREAACAREVEGGLHAGEKSSNRVAAASRTSRIRPVHRRTPQPGAAQSR